METKFVYEFCDEVKYFKDGKESVAQTLTVFAPNNKVLNETTIIENELNRSQMKALEIMRNSFGSEQYDKMVKDKPEEKNKDKQIQTPDQIIITMSTGGADLMRCYNALKHILCLKVDGKTFCVLDDTEKMTSNIFDDMTPKDTKIILGKYILTFLIASQNN